LSLLPEKNRKGKKLNSSKLPGFAIVCIILFLVFVLISPSYGGEKNRTESTVTFKDASESVNASKAKEAADHKIIVYYFHMTARCETCMKIEKFTLEAVNNTFAKELEAGAIQTKVINIDETANSHFEKDYKLRAQAVIVSDMAGFNERRWKNLEKIWDYVSDEEKFKEYIVNEIKAYL
jgi:hypothetical protein